MAHRQSHPMPETRPSPPLKQLEKVRDGGPDAMESPPRTWSDVDEASNESLGKIVKPPFVEGHTGVARVAVGANQS